MKVAGPLVLMMALLGASAGTPDGKLGPEILRGAFDNLYGYDLQMVLVLELRSEGGETSTRKTEVARKQIEGLTHSFGHFLEPPWMRGTRMLLVDNTDRSDDVFLFLPENDRIRRLNSVQRQDYFLGSDFWYEDLERRNVEDYRVTATSSDVHEGRDVHVVDAEPVHETTAYARVRFVVDRENLVMRRILFYRKGSVNPLREILFDRASILEEAGFRIPTRLIVTNHLRRTTTVALFDQLKVNPELSDSLFRSTALLTKRRIPGLTDGAEKDE